MAGRKLTVVISQAPGKNPVKRRLEEEIATRLMLSGAAEVSVVPHLYDLTADNTGMLWLKSLRGNLVVLGWLYPRAIRWVLDRSGVKGKEGQSRLNVVEDENADDEDRPPEEPAESRGIGSIDVPNRLIYAIDLRNDGNPDTYIQEIERLSEVTSAPLVQLGSLGGLPILSSNGSNGSAGTNGSAKTAESAPAPEANGTPSLPIVPPAVIGGDDIRRRWYPVIDYSRCTNCMECIDFCLFGVYGVDHSDRILVEEQDNCKKGCPACSRVCPVNAIIFPEHKTPGIAGADGGPVEDFKIDLSKLFGAPSALEMAVLERDQELVADGREAVGAAVGLPKRQTCQAEQPRDALDDLMDGLDALDL
ncbi:MAG: ferredoxin family protein [Planctomycetes bacterium]|nr:ferredoxin family protein [Planctomycetota bacterium]